MKNSFLILALFIFILSCGMEPTYDQSQLVGNWKSVAWNDLTNKKTVGVDVSFKFDEDGRYIGSYGQQKEEGKFWIAGANLHTIEDGKAEKKVKIEKLQNDTLVFGMNRMGNLEEIVLIKDQ